MCRLYLNPDFLCDNQINFNVHWVVDKTSKEIINFIRYGNEKMIMIKKMYQHQDHLAQWIELCPTD